jgi:predicted transcriptional regulator
MAKEKRVEILFEPTDYERLSEIARRDHKSVGSVVREAVAKYVASPSNAERSGAMRRLLALESNIDWGTPEELSKEISRASYEAVMKSLERSEAPEAQ